MKGLRLHGNLNLAQSSGGCAFSRLETTIGRIQGVDHHQVKEISSLASTSIPTRIRTSSASSGRPIGTFAVFSRSRFSQSLFGPSSSSRNSPSVIGKASYCSEAVLPAQPVVHDVFEPKTGTWQYIVADPSTLNAVVIDPVLDYDRETQVITTTSADGLLSLAKDRGYNIVRILETHAHADHLTAASYLQRVLETERGHKPAVGIGKRIGQVQALFGQRYGVPENERQGAFDKLFEDDETFSIGKLQATAIHLPGHTPDHLGYKIGDNVFCGDSLFHVDIGTARCDFPGGSANNLFQSGRRLLSLPDHVKIWTGHDYPPEGRVVPVAWMTVRDHRAQNKHLKDGITEDEFVAQRKERDAKLGEPKLLHQSLQTNIRAGRLPKPTASGHRMLRLPLKLGGLQW